MTKKTNVAVGQPRRVVLVAAHACRLVDREHLFGSERSRIETAESLIIEAAEQRLADRARGAAKR